MLVSKIDYRIGGKPRYYVGEESEQLMQVPDEIKKCVVFVGYKTQQKIEWRGSAFCVSCPLTYQVNSSIKRHVDGSDTSYSHYLVTAKHCIDAIKAQSIDGKVWIRINLRNGSVKPIETNVDDWKFHPTEEDSVDAAVLGWNPENEYDFVSIPVDDMIADDGFLKREIIGEGDEVFVTGLFTMHYGSKRNLPIVRSGNIALMPKEKVRTTMFGGVRADMDAYLIEGRSIGGLSGSPVFVYLGLFRYSEGKIQKSVDNQPIFFWLGLIHGHWKIAQNEVDVIMDMENTKEKKSEKVDELNMGIAIVVPAIKIAEILNRDDFVNMRKVEDKKRKERNLPVLDFGSVEPTKEEFEKTLKKVSRKIKTSELDPSKPKT